MVMVVIRSAGDTCGKFPLGQYDVYKLSISFHILIYSAPPWGGYKLPGWAPMLQFFVNRVRPRKIYRNSTFPPRFALMMACILMIPRVEGASHFPATDEMAPALCTFGLPAVVVFNSHYYATAQPGYPSGVRRIATWAGPINWSYSNRGHSMGMASTGRITLAGHLSSFTMSRVTTIAPWAPHLVCIANDNHTSPPPRTTAHHV